MTPEQIRQEAERETYFKNQVAKEKGYPSWDEMFNSVCREDQYPSVAGILIESATKDAISRQLATKLEEKEKEIAAYIKVAMKVLEEKEKEIAELVDCLQETIRCCAVFKDNMLSADVTISEHCDQIEVAKQILKKHNP